MAGEKQKDFMIAYRFSQGEERIGGSVYESVRYGVLPVLATSPEDAIEKVRGLHTALSVTRVEEV